LLRSKKKIAIRGFIKKKVQTAAAKLNYEVGKKKSVYCGRGVRSCWLLEKEPGFFQSNGKKSQKTEKKALKPSPRPTSGGSPNKLVREGKKTSCLSFLSKGGEKKHPQRPIALKEKGKRRAQRGLIVH